MKLSDVTSPWASVPIAQPIRNQISARAAIEAGRTLRSDLDGNMFKRNDDLATSEGLKVSDNGIMWVFVGWQHRLWTTAGNNFTVIDHPVAVQTISVKADARVAISRGPIALWSTAREVWWRTAKTSHGLACLQRSMDGETWVTPHGAWGDEVWRSDPGPWTAVVIPEEVSEEPAEPITAVDVDSLRAGLAAFEVD